MRNVDKLRGAENQIDALKRRLAKAQQENADMKAAVQEIQAAMDAVIIAIARKYGVGDFEGPGLNGEAPGRRLLIDPPNVAEAAGFKITVNAGKSGGKDFREIIVTKEETKE